MKDCTTEELTEYHQKIIMSLFQSHINVFLYIHFNFFYYTNYNLDKNTKNVGRELDMRFKGKSYAGLLQILL